MHSKEEAIKEFFLETDIQVAPSMERALGYFGVSRWVAFHRSRRLNSLCWADSRFNTGLSASTVWHRFLAHPFVAPHLQLRRPDGNVAEALDFEAKDDDPDLLPTLPNGEIDERALDTLHETDRFIEYSRKLAYAILLDTVRRRVYIARWADAFAFLNFYKDENPFETLREMLREAEIDGRPRELLHEMLRGHKEEDDGEMDEIEIRETSDWDDEPLPVDPATEKRVLAWLDRRWNNWVNLYQLALLHWRHRQYSNALEPLQRALAIRPESAVINWMASQVYGALERWPEALEACKKTDERVLSAINRPIH